MNSPSCVSVDRPDWDIFCVVVDNYGDIGVCWRLARQLSAELGMSVRLWVDDLASFARLCPSLAPSLDAQSIEGIEVRRWDAAALPALTPAKRVIEAFACNLPEGFVQAMAACQPAPVWPSRACGWHWAMSAPTPIWTPWRAACASAFRARPWC